MDGPDGVVFNAPRDMWEPRPDCGAGRIPFEWTDSARRWALRRAQEIDLVKDETGEAVVEKGWLLGPDCAPSNLECANPSVCFCSLQDAERTEKGTFVLRTRTGPVKRRIWSIICPECKYENSWDPESECIHTIRNGQEGGEAACACFFLFFLFPSSFSL